MKKVLVITYYWPPSGGAGVQRTLKFARFLPEYGIEPIVITVNPDVASYPVRDESLLQDVPKELQLIYTKSFEPLNYLAKIAGKEKVPYGGFSNTSKDTLSQKMLRWIRGNIFIPDARIGWVRYAVKAATAQINKHKIDTVFISSPPHSSQLIGLQLKKKFPAIKWIADLRDPWTRIYYYPELLHTAIAKKADANLERSVLQHCDAAIVVSDSIRTQFASLTQVSPTKIAVIPNGYDEDDFSDSVGSPNDTFMITYVGTLAESYKPEVFFKALSGLINLNSKVKIRFRLVGTLPSSVKELISKYALEPITELISYVPHAEAIRFMQQSHINLLLIPETTDAAGILTGKLFEYLGARRPILGIGPVDGDAAAIVNQCEAGEFFSRDNAETIETWMQFWYSKWEKGESFETNSDKHLQFRRRTLSGKLASIINSENHSSAF